METVSNKIRQLIREEINKTFLLQERFSSKQIDDAVDAIKNELIEFEDAVIEDNYRKETPDKKAKILTEILTIYVRNKNIFFKDLVLAIRFVKVKKEYPLNHDELKTNARGSFGEDYGFIDSADKKLTKSKINIDYTFNEGEFDTKILTALVYHEVLHMYELYNKILNGKSGFSDKHMIYNMFMKKLLEKAKENKCYDFLERLSRIIYCLCYFEKNAFVTSLYGKLLDCESFNLRNANEEFLQTKTYSSYYEPLKNVNENLNINLINNESSEFIKNNLNDLIKETVEEYNNWNINNKVTINEIPFKYNGESIEQYLSKIKKIAKNELIKFEKILPGIYKKVLYTRYKKLRGINERYFVFERRWYKFGL